MPYINPEEQGDRQSHTLRVGLTHPALGGMDKESDRGAIADNEFFDIQNARRRGGRWFARGGQSKVITTPIAFPVVGLFDLTSPGIAPSALGLAPVGSGGPCIFALNGAGPSQQTILAAYDGHSNAFLPFLQAEVASAAAYGLAVSPSGQLIGTFKNSTGFAALAPYTDVLALQRGPYAPVSSTIANMGNSLIGSFPHSMIPVGGGSLVNLFGVGMGFPLRTNLIVFVSSSNDGTHNYFHAFDTVKGSLTLENTLAVTTARQVYSAVNFRDTTVFLPGNSVIGVSTDVTYGVVRDATGAYTNLTLTANNTNSTLIPNSGNIDQIKGLIVNSAVVVSFAGTDTLYIAGQGTVFQTGTNFGPRGVLLTWDGTTLKVVRVIETSPATCTPIVGTSPFGGSMNPWGIISLAWFKNGKLFYTYANNYPAAACGGVATNICRLGSYDGTTFNDTVEDFNTDAVFTGQTYMTPLYYGVYQGKPLVILYDTVGGDTIGTSSLDVSGFPVNTWQKQGRFTSGGFFQPPPLTNSPGFRTAVF